VFVRKTRVYNIPKIRFVSYKNFFFFLENRASYTYTYVRINRTNRGHAEMRARRLPDFRSVEKIKIPEFFGRP